MSLRTIKYVFVRKVLTHYLAAHDTKTAAARALGMDRRYLSRLMRQHGVVKACLIGYVLFFASGCAIMSQDLQKEGQVVKCETFGFGIIGTPIALASYYSCVKNAEQLGFAKIER